MLLVKSSAVIGLPPQYNICSFVFLLTSRLVNLLVFAYNSVRCTAFVTSKAVTFASFAFGAQLKYTMFSP